MQKINYKIILWLIVIIFGIITFGILKNTFALFENNAYAIANTDIGKWVIKLNNNLISDGVLEELSIDNFIYEEKDTVESGYIAPGTSAYFDLVFDATDCDVAVKYDIEFLFDQMDYSDNISVSVTQTGSNDSIQTSENTYSGLIDLDSIINKELITLRISITWEDIEEFNESDTLLGTTENNSLSVPIQIRAIQYLGEEIEEYNNG